MNIQLKTAIPYLNEKLNYMAVPPPSSAKLNTFFATNSNKQTLVTPEKKYDLSKNQPEQLKYKAAQFSTKVLGVICDENHPEKSILARIERVNGNCLHCLMKSLLTIVYLQWDTTTHSTISEMTPV